MKAIRKIFGISLIALVLVLGFVLMPNRAEAASISKVNSHVADVAGPTLVKYDGTWYYVKNGKVDYSTTLVKYNGTWYYVSGGTLKNATTLCKYNGKWYYVENGKLSGKTTLVKYNGTWFYVSGGTLKNATTLCKYNGKWYYVENGKLSSKTTLVKYNGTWFYVSGGTLKNATTLCKYNGTWFYVENGKLSSKTTLCKYNGKWYYVENGKLSAKTALVKYGNYWFYVSGGTIHPELDGEVMVNGKTYYLNNGILTTCHVNGHDIGPGNDCTRCGVFCGAEDAQHTVSVRSVGGLPLTDVNVYIYTDSAMTQLADYATTNEDGTVTFTLPAGANYKIVLSGVPKGYQLEDSYSFTGISASIVLTSALITDDDLSNASLGLGDVMYDFTITTSDGKTLTLSEVLAEKEMVMLNFWYSYCTYCVQEFPYIEEAYQQFKNDAEIIALNSFDQASDIAPFKAEHGLSFPMASCSYAFTGAFNIYGYPTTVVIDRYGVISLIQLGYIAGTEHWECLFEHFTAEDYVQGLYDGIESLPNYG